jgi:signal transduction histidine kinase
VKDSGNELCTPLTRMRLVLEILPADTDPALVGRLRQDLEEMERLIGDTLELARGLEPSPPEEVDLREFVDGVAAAFRRDGAVIRWSPAACCYVAAAWRRVSTSPFVQSEYRTDDCRDVRVTPWQVFPGIQSKGSDPVDSLFRRPGLGILCHRFRRLYHDHSRLLAIGTAPVGPIRTVPVVPPVIIMIVIEYLIGPPGWIHQIRHIIPCLGGLGRYCSPKERCGSQYNHGSL